MKQNIKYSYCVDDDNNLIHINSISNATRHSRKWFCLQCGQEMVANLGNKKSWYFSHKADTACDGESYLHKLAKRRIKEKFDNSNSFPIEFVREVPCHEAEHCLFVDEFHCHSGKHITIKRDLKSWDNNSIYDTCSPEVVIDEFRPDLLLTNSLKPNREPVFIEIYKTHKSEEEKIKSNHRVIETKKIKSEEDINDIIKYGFIEGQNCEMYNFKLKPSYPYYIGSNPPVDRFIIYKSGLTYIISAMDYELNCEDLNRRHDSRSVAELNIGINNYLSIILEGSTKYLNSIELGLLYLVSKGWKIKNCNLCKYYKFNYFSNYCTLYKVNNIGRKYLKPNEATNCNRYELNQELRNIPLSELEKFIEIVPNN